MVDNAGHIATPNGQSLLVGATDKVYLQEAGGNSDVRGLLVEVQTGGAVNNHGSINVGKGNATLLGYAVNQDGLVSAQTSVRVNGTIRLLARENAQTLREDQSFALKATSTRRATAGDDGLGDRAAVILGAGSVTQILPDSADTATAVDSQAQQRSHIEVQGNTVQMEGTLTPALSQGARETEGASIRAPSGQVELTATEHPDDPGRQGISNDSRIYLAPGSHIDVAGIRNVSLHIERNVVAVELHSNELRDSPLQHQGLLNGKTIAVDIRQGTPIADISGAVAQISRTINERSTSGGTVALHSEGDVISRTVVDIAGGSVDYRDGHIQTTQLVGDDGQIVDISQADPNRRYVATLGDLALHHSRWGITERWSVNGPIAQGVFAAGYSEAKDAGSVDIQANRLLLDGRVTALTRLDLQQRAAAMPLGGALSIDLGKAPDSQQDIILQALAAATELALTEPFPQEAEHPVPLLLTANRFLEDGLNRLTFKTNGVVSVAANARVPLRAGGSLSATGGEIHVAGAIDVSAGKVVLQTQLTSATYGQLSGGVVLEPSARIDVSGTFVNDTGTFQTQQQFLPVTIDGGGVSIKTNQGDLNVASGASIRADGGAWLDQRGRTNAGRGGNIALEAAGIDGANLRLDGEVSAYGLQQGGQLSLTSNEILLGDGPADATAQIVSNQQTPLRLLADFFTGSGFSQYHLFSNLNGIRVEDGAKIHPTTANLEFIGDPRLQPSGSDMSAFARPVLLPEMLRQPASISLSLAQTTGRGRDDAALTVGTDARLATDPRGTISLVSDASIIVQGAVEALAGAVNLTVTPPQSSLEPGFLPNQGVWLDAGSRINVRGTTLLQPDALGLRRGEVLAGAVSPLPPTVALSSQPTVQFWTLLAQRLCWICPVQCVAA